MVDTSKETNGEEKSAPAVPASQSHEELHAYSGGQFVEHTNTVLSPYLWISWGIVIAAIVVAVLYYGAIPGLKIGGAHYPYNPERTASGYMEVANEMSQVITTVPPTDQAYVSMSALNKAIGDGQPLAASISDGQELYQHYCIGCHGPNQDGAGPNAVNLNPAPRNLRNAPFMQAMSLQRMETSIHKGVPGTAMPRWENTLTDTQINELIIYVLSLTAPVDEKGNFLDPLSGAGKP